MPRPMYEDLVFELVLSVACSNDPPETEFVNVFTDLQSTCDLCFAVVLHEKLPLRTCHVTMCTPQALCCVKRFSW